MADIDHKPRDKDNFDNYGLYVEETSILMVCM